MLDGKNFPFFLPSGAILGRDCFVKSVQSSLSHLISTSVPRATFTRSMDYFNTIYIEKTDPWVGFHNLMNNLKHLTSELKRFGCYCQ